MPSSLHLYQHLVICSCGDAQGDRALWSRILDRIVHEIEQHLLDAIGIGPGEWHFGIDRDFDGEIECAGLFNQSTRSLPAPADPHPVGLRLKLSAAESARDSTSRSLTRRISRSVSVSTVSRKRSRTSRSFTAPARSVSIVPLIDGKRCAQFVRDVGDKIDLHLARSLQARGHVVEGVTQAAQLITRIDLHRVIETPLGYGFGRGGELLHGARDAAREPPAHKRRQRQCDQRREQEPRAQIIQHRQHIAQALAEVSHADRLPVAQDRHRDKGRRCIAGRVDAAGILPLQRARRRADRFADQRLVSDCAESTST